MNLFGQRRNKRHEVVLGDAALREPGSEMMVARDRAREHGNVLSSEHLESRKRFWSAGAQQVTGNRW